MRNSKTIQEIVSRNQITYSPVSMTPHIFQRKALKICEKYRSTWGANQSQMAELMGVSAGTYRNWLFCKRLMPASAIESLARIAGVDLAAILEEIKNEL